MHVKILIFAGIILYGATVGYCFSEEVSYEFSGQLAENIMC